jgi:hypothetical protein
VLCGVGGRTVEEAKENLTYDEYVNWCRYRSKWGGLHVGMRIDRAVAHALRAYFNAHSKTANLRFPSFSPYDEAAKKSVNVESPDEVFALLSSLAKEK